MKPFAQQKWRSFCCRPIRSHRSPTQLALVVAVCLLSKEGKARKKGGQKKGTVSLSARYCVSQVLWTYPSQDFNVMSCQNNHPHIVWKLTLVQVTLLLSRAAQTFSSDSFSNGRWWVWWANVKETQNLSQKILGQVGSRPKLQRMAFCEQKRRTALLLQSLQRRLQRRQVRNRAASSKCYAQEKHFQCKKLPYTNVMPFVKGQTQLQKWVREGEARPTAFLAEHSVPFNAMGHLLDVVKATCHDSKIAKSITCSRTECTAIVKSIIVFFPTLLS